jgi:hypothetical protein
MPFWAWRSVMIVSAISVMTEFGPDMVRVDHGSMDGWGLFGTLSLRRALPGQEMT